MPANLQINNALSTTAQSVRDQSGNISPLALSTDFVGIGTTNPTEKLVVLGAVNIKNPGEGQVLLFLGIERHWQLRQFGTDAGAALELASVGGGGNKNFLISTTGRVGIGTTNPQARLHVEGDIVASGDIRLLNADCAEEFDMCETEQVEPGTVMVLGEEGKLEQSQNAYDKRVAGVVSGAGDYKPGIVLDKQESSHTRKPIALLGKVFCKVDAKHEVGS